MSQSITEIRRLLAGREAIPARVISISGNIVRLATPEGVRELAVQEALRPGDPVVIREGQVVRTQQYAATAPIYHV